MSDIFGFLGITVSFACILVFIYVVFPTYYKVDKISNHLGIKEDEE